MAEPVDITAKGGTPDLQAEPMLINIGPSHPATHATLRFQATLDGETILDLVPEFGYLHRGFEKESEAATWTQVIPYTDRLNYVSPLMNNVGYAMAVEKLCGIEITERCKYVRVIISELSRIIDHMVCIGTNMVDLGALTNFWYFWKPREEVYFLIEELCGQRLTTSYTRIGGAMADLPEGWTDRLLAVCRGVIPECIADVNALLTKNRIFIERTMGVGPITAKDAIALGFTGPCLRAAGVPLDLRKDEPYLVYDRFDFDIPIGEAGDTCDRYMVRMEEMRQSLRIIEQAVATASRRPHQHRRPPVHPSGEGAGVREHRGADEPLQVHHGGGQGPGRRGLLGDRGGQRRARVLHREQGRGRAVQDQGPAAVLPAVPGDPAPREGADDRGSHRRSGERQHHRGGAGPVSVAFSETGRAEFERLLTRYPDRKAVILPALHLAQKEFGYVSDEAIVYIAGLVGTSPAEIEGVATFYTMYNRKPVGKYHVQICRNISCSLLGAEHLIEHVSKKLGVRPGETTPDGKFTLAKVECLGSCGTAPVMQVNDEYHENLTVESIDRILDQLP